MPQKKHLRGVGGKEQRMYEHIKESAKKEGRYGKRAEEVAARTVMKHHKEEGHKKVPQARHLRRQTRAVLRSATSACAPRNNPLKRSTGR